MKNKTIMTVTMNMETKMAMMMLMIIITIVTITMTIIIMMNYDNYFILPSYAFNNLLRLLITIKVH